MEKAKEALAQLRTHISRLRKGLLERLLETGEVLTPEALTRLLTIPTARAMLTRFVWITSDGKTGLLEVEPLALRDLHGTMHPLTTPVALAHPYHLAQENNISEWQQEIVHRRIVQPVK